LENTEAHRHVPNLVGIASEKLQTQQALTYSLQCLLQVIE
jgi:hypothetical protein